MGADNIDTVLDFCEYLREEGRTDRQVQNFHDSLTVLLTRFAPDGMDLCNPDPEHVKEALNALERAAAVGTVSPRQVLSYIEAWHRFYDEYPEFTDTPEPLKVWVDERVSKFNSAPVKQEEYQPAQ